MSDPRDLYRFLLTIGLGCAGGYLASLLNLPLAWMIGAMLANTAAALLGAPLYVFAWLRNVMVCVLGVMLGSSFTPEILGVIGDWAVSLLLLAAYVAAAGGGCFVYFRRVCGFDRATACCTQSSSPGRSQRQMSRYSRSPNRAWSSSRAASAGPT